MVVVGNDMALITAALQPRRHARGDHPALFHDTAALAPKTRAYPLEEINDYLRAFPRAPRRCAGRWPTTISWPSRRASRATTLIMAGAPGAVLDARGPRAAWWRRCGAR